MADNSDQGTQIDTMTSDTALDRVSKVLNLNEPAVAVRGAYTIVADKDSNEILDMTALAPSAKLAAKMINALVLVYNQSMSQQSSTVVGRMAKATHDQMVSVGARLDAAESAKSAYTKSLGSIDPATQTSQAVTQLYVLKNSLVDTQKSLAVAQAQEAYYKQQVATLDPSIVPSLNFESNPRIENDKAQLEQLEQQRIQLSSEFTPKDQQMIDNQNQIDIIKQQMADERQQESQNLSFSLKGGGRSDTSPSGAYILSGGTRELNPLRETARSNVFSAQAEIDSDLVQEQVLNKSIGDLQAAVKSTPDALRKMEDMQADIDVLRSIYTQLQSQNAQLQARLPAEQTYALFLTAPVVPKKQMSPRPMLYSVVAGLVGALAGFIIAVLLDTGDGRLRDSYDAEELFGRPVLQRLPASKVLELSLSGDSDLEPYRELAYSLGYLGVGSSIRSLLITSTVRDEGTTSVASNLAVALSKEGRRVVLIDANVKRPALHIMFGKNNNEGLAGLMRNGAVPEHALLPIDNCSSLSLIPGGEADAEIGRGDMLNAEKFEFILTSLKARADIVIVDAPAVFAGFETSVLANKVDGIIFVSRTGLTSRANARKAFDLLQNCRAPIIGTVLNSAKD